MVQQLPSMVNLQPFSASTNSESASQIQPVPKNLIFMQQPSQPTELPSNRYTLKPLPDGRFVIHQVQSHTPQELQSHPPFQLQGQQTSIRYVFSQTAQQPQQPNGINLPFKQWNATWNPQMSFQAQNHNHQIGGSFPRQLNLPGQIHLPAQSFSVEVSFCEFPEEIYFADVDAAPSIGRAENCGHGVRQPSTF